MLPPFAAYELPYPKACHVYLNGTQTIPINTWTVVAINAVLWDTYGLYTGGASQYITIPEDGLYLVIASVATMTAVSAPIGGGVYKNNGIDFALRPGYQTYSVAHFELVYMNMFTINDKLDLRVHYPGTASIDIGNTWNSCFMQVLKLPYITKGY